MDNFNINSFFKNQYLKESDLKESEAQSLAQDINKSIQRIDDLMSYKDFAKAVAMVLKGEDGIDGYGTHNYEPFMKVLHSELGEDGEISIEEGYEEVSSSYDKIISLIQQEARKLDDDDAFDLHEKLKKFFNKLI